MQYRTRYKDRSTKGIAMSKYKDTLIVNILGGPGSGKSTTRAALFSKLKLLGYNCEESIEWCKAKVYDKNPYVFKDQLYMFSKQRKSILQMINDVDIIVTDSPIILSAIYEDPYDAVHSDLYRYEFSRFNNLNILLDRKKKYNPVGRHQNEEEAKGVDMKIREALDNFNILCYNVPGDENAPSAIYQIMLGVLKS